MIVPPDPYHVHNPCLTDRPTDQPETLAEQLALAFAGLMRRPRPWAGPQPENQIGTLSEQWALAQTPRPSLRGRVRGALWELVGDDFVDIAVAVYEELGRQ
jgi:hypothetical protein